VKAAVCTGLQAGMAIEIKESGMKLKLLQNEQIQFLKKALNVYEMQQRAIARNVANANNPNYQRAKTDFSDVLRGAEAQGGLKVNNSRHIVGSGRLSGSESVTEKRKSVDLMEEMALLAENQIRHEFTTRFLRQKYDGIKRAISGKK